MALSSAARSRWILAVILLACIVVAWSLRRPRPPQYAEAYVGDRAAMLWSTTAQVRQTVATLHYGERVAILRRTTEQSQVRTTDGIQGWVDNRLLMDPALWKQAASLLAGVKALPVQASGRTRALSNVHIEPGRDTPRIFQFGRNVPVVVFERKLTFAPHAAQTSAGEDAAGGEDTAKAGAEKSGADGDENKDDKKEDWLLVSRVLPQKTVVAAAAAPAANSLPSAGTASPDAGAPEAASAPAPHPARPLGWRRRNYPYYTWGPCFGGFPRKRERSRGNTHRWLGSCTLRRARSPGPHSRLLERRGNACRSLDGAEYGSRPRRRQAAISGGWCASRGRATLRFHTTAGLYLGSGAAAVRNGFRRR